MGMAVVMPALAQDNFPDVPTDPPHWAMEALANLKRDGILVGYPDGLFRGGRPASRYEMAVAINAAYNRLREQMTGLETQITELKNGVPGGGGMTAEQVAEMRRQLDELRSTVDGMRGYGEDIANLKRLVQEFAPQLESLGADVRAMKQGLSDLEDRVKRLEAIKPAVTISGDLNLLVLGGIGTNGRNGLTPDGRLTGVGRGSYGGDGTGGGGPAVGLTRDLTVAHEAAFRIAGTNETGPKWYATLVAGNLLPTIGDQSTQYLLAGFDDSNPTDLYMQDLVVSFDTSLMGQGFSAAVGRLGYQISPYIFKRQDFTTYFDNPRWDNGDYYFDGGLVGFRFGGARLNVFGGRNSDRNTTNGTDLNPILFASGKIDQSLGFHLSAPIGQMGSINLAYLFLDSNTVNSPIPPTTRPFNRLNVFGGDVALKFQNLAFTAGYSKTPFTYNTSKSYDRDNAAVFGDIAYTGPNFGANIGYRRIENAYAAPGAWGRLGTYYNPTNIEGANGGAYLQLSPAFRLSAKGEFVRQVSDLDGNGRRDKISTLIGEVDYKFTNTWNLMASYEYVTFDNNNPGVTIGDARQNWFTVGLGYALGSNAKFDIRYQASDLKNLLNSPYTSFGADRYTGGLLSTQFSIRF